MNCRDPNFSGTFGLAHALNRVKLNPQVYSLQEEITAEFHPDRSTFERMMAEEPLAYNKVPSVNKMLTLCTPLNLHERKLSWYLLIYNVERVLFVSIIIYS